MSLLNKLLQPVPGDQREAPQVLRVAQLAVQAPPELLLAARLLARVRVLPQAALLLAREPQLRAAWRQVRVRAQQLPLALLSVRSVQERLLPLPSASPR